MKTPSMQGRSSKENIISLASLVVLLLFFSFGSYFVKVFALPPDGNLAAPVHTGSAAQTKSGPLLLGSYLGASGEPVLIGRSEGSFETLLYFGAGRKLKVQENNGSAPVLTVASGVVGINQSNPSSEADLDIGSKGIRLGGVIRNTWPDGSGTPITAYPGASVKVEYKGGQGRSASCPQGHFMRGISTWRNSNQGDNYITYIHCTKLDGLEFPPPEEQQPEPDPICEPSPRDPEEIICAL
jgi:hypothetical protein